MDRRRIAVSPVSRPAMFEAMVEAVIAGGGEPAPIAEASALMWADPAAATEFPLAVAGAPELEWVQLPYAGIEKFAANLDPSLIWTCGKGVYAEPVAEHVITLTLAAFRDLHISIPASSWPAQTGRNLLGARVTVIGAGGITESLLRLLEPWNTTTTVVRRSSTPMPGAHRTVLISDVHDAIADADVVVLAAALTAETHNLVDAAFLDAMNSDGWLVNVARGGLVETDALVAALDEGSIAGAALDVTEPEPLPDGHPLWDIEQCIITPHVGNTPEMGLPLIAERVRQNVVRWIAGEDLIGLVDVEAGY
ncbi:MAG: D-isomer specific 2-hydroxyacid dehydrogenase family protein [Acidimicrobiia bacterium]|nr:D-isomer specific 2-hydroxyacid dehydrogenase family protein [Acidimicrobiia bacterium]